MTLDQATFDRHGLTTDEYDRIVKILGREPTVTELGIFSVMWSEHCSYKSSRLHLRRLPTKGRHVVQGPGENAGAVDIGGGLVAVFKIESHNHPSFIEPYQGAATGVGGIIRDIFTMGARPIALMNSLRFASMAQPATRRLLEGVVAGIAGYGNSIGIPTIGGEVAFEECYAGNPLVNVFCLGIGRADALVKAVASGVGNPVFYVGAKTGRDGLHGATMASAEFDERSMEQRPAVQVGDPFMEKLLLEACLEAMRTDALVGVQDMGAAGLTCSTCEMGSRGGSGIDIDISLVPQRETGMTPYEIMLSESQERMLLIVKRGREAEIERIFEKWDLHAVKIGEVTSDGLLRVKINGRVVAEIPNHALTDEAPLYDRPRARPAYVDDVHALDLARLDTSRDAGQVLRELLASPTIADKRWIYRQYDHMVRTNTLVLPGMGTGVVRVKGASRALAMSLDGNGRFCYLDPRRGAMLAVAESARNVACAGGQPVGATNCLNFASPERPEIMWQFSETIDGIAEACRALDVPITGGNVSFYNESGAPSAAAALGCQTEGVCIYPTPVIGVVGVIEDSSRTIARAFREGGTTIVLLGESRLELGGSEYLKAVHGMVRGTPPEIDLAAERRLQELLVQAARDGSILSAHDCAEGGIAVALAECCFDSGGMGAEVDLPVASPVVPVGPPVFGGAPGAAAAPGAPRPVADLPEGVALVGTLFGESASRAIVSATAAQLPEVLRLAQEKQVPARVIGRTGGRAIRISVAGRRVIDLPVEQAESIWKSALAQYYDKAAAKRAE
jgi:phosphoribosylformylglycinamidine synthase